MDKIKANVKEIQLKLDLDGNTEDELKNKINIILNKIQKLIIDVNEIKDIFNSQIEKLKKENIILKESLKQMENKMNELQGIIIGRKLIKIIIKAIIKNCFINFQILENEKGIYSKYNATLKDKKYFPMIKIINNLIEAITTSNGIIHLIDSISKSIIIINKNSTFEDIINICQMAI